MCSCNRKKVKRVKSATRIHAACVHIGFDGRGQKGDGGYCVTNRSTVCAVPRFFSFFSLQDHSYYCY
jgi:hypothetical protein